MKRETIRHPKTYDLAARLGCSRAEALGFLTLLWDYTGEHSPQGDVGKWGNGAIARACDFTGNPDAFVAALAESKWVDRHDKHRLIIHDWPDHCEDWVRKKLERSKLRFLDCYGVDASSSVHKKRGNRELEPISTAAPRSETSQEEARQTGATAEPSHTPAENEKPNNPPHGVPAECNKALRGVPTSQTAESLSNPNRTHPNPTDPNRTDPERPGPTSQPAGQRVERRRSGSDTSRAGPDGAGKNSSSGLEISGFAVDASDEAVLLEACKRIAEVIAVGKGGKARDDRELIFKTAVLLHLGKLSEAFVADTLATIKEKKPTLPAAFFLSGVQLRCEKQGLSFYWLLDKVIVPDWAVPIIEKRPRPMEACA